MLQLPAKGVKGRWERRSKAVSRVLFQTPCGCDIIIMDGTINAIRTTPDSENGAWPSPLRSLVGSSCSTHGLIATGLRLCLSLLLHCDLASHRCTDCKLEHFMHTRHFFATTFDIRGAHLARDVLALLCGYWRKTLGSKKLNARSFIAQI